MIRPLSGNINERDEKMGKRYVSIWFRHLATDWCSLRQPYLKNLPFVLRKPDHGRMLIAAANATAEKIGIHVGMTLADARVIQPDLLVQDYREDLPEKLLLLLAEWCIRFTPIAAVDLPDGLLLDVSGCAHLWGGEKPYLETISQKLQMRGYDIRVSIADTPGVAWGMARYGKDRIVPPGRHREALQSLPPEALRLEQESVDRLHKLGLHQVSQFIHVPRPSLRKRFGPQFLSRLDMALGLQLEPLIPVIPPEPYQERLPCMEPVLTAPGIAMALEELLKSLCLRLQGEQNGLRHVRFSCFRVDGKCSQIEIGTNRPSHHVRHLMKLFELKITSIEPGLGIELFLLEATKVEEHFSKQEKMWEEAGGLGDSRLSELLDRLAVRVGEKAIHRYLPEEHYWPERSIKSTTSLSESISTEWREKLRPLELLSTPELIEVTAPIPDYPPMLFRRKGTVHKVVRADGPERIEQEWWLQQGQHRDYYRVEVADGHRYWLFRLGHYDDQKYQWFLHGVFA